MELRILHLDLDYPDKKTYCIQVFERTFTWKFWKKTGYWDDLTNIHDPEVKLFDETEMNEGMILIVNYFSTLKYTKPFKQSNEQSTKN